MRVGWVLVILGLATSPIFSAEGVEVFDRPFFRSATVMSRPSATEVTPNLSVEPDAALIELIVRDAPDESWRAQVKGLSVADVRAGDVLLARFDLRALEVDPLTHEAAVQVVIQKAEPPFTVHDQAYVVASSERQTFQTPLRVRENVAAGKLQLAINFGVCRQRLELSNVGATNLGARRDTLGLRQPPVTYAGREPEAAWRKAAEERIERIRKGNLSIRVVDADGKPVPDAQVNVSQLRHAFAFGTAVTADRILGDSADDRRYREVLLGHFNTAVFENDMKWVRWNAGSIHEQRAHRQRVLAAVDWLRDNGFGVRGHCIIWPGWQGPNRLVPDEVRRLAESGDIPTLRGRIAAHINDMTSTFAGKVDEWDVVNEPMHQHALLDVVGRSAMIEWFAQARRSDPAARLYVNDYVFLSYGALNGSKIQRYYDELKLLIARAPIDGIGEQAHFDEVLIAPARMIALLDRMARLARPIRVTEFDIATDDEQLQADFTRDFLTAAFSHEAVNGVVLWGFWQGQHWKPNAALWRRDWSAKPNATVWDQLVNRQWRTNATVTTDSSGQASVRGFLGRYRVEAKGASSEVELPAAGAAIVLRLPR